ncbi:carboxylesterase 1C-like [Mizuhopecten yessoensis]|uniref:Carboxylic ester hydrolase n=1 Tax=Mizuhopecten yessoensis TaxID=6573 RepID=A0A210PEK1_MIZYE|nr:carboxylesterase 1C-like [Mizuhopecten yessoensis]XP_021343573.1 carboxylesterase 1C-like [Mizuhopecten yessoensis]XP_021343574.1 carboxylesterase 1C-like [Mizuhopecten yessoensis]OWF34922.1 Liver carboxylesterase [Mizuhopecten yessoensis]
MRAVQLALMFTATLLSTECYEPARVHTDIGDLQGVLEIIRNETVYQFRNIPYAKPPIGPLRFKKPVAHGGWSGVLDCTEFGPSCLQQHSTLDRYLPNLNQSEDCLSLDMYIPRTLSSSANRSVMVFVFGGGFLVGQGTLYDGSFLALTGDVIVVTLNYRLGVFGFLANPAQSLLGNYGLWDQRLALEWVHAHIANFGGNPNSVTLFGQSAGSFSVSLQSLYPKNKGLFHRVIAHSGVAEGHFAIWHNAYAYAKDIGIYLGCANTTSYADCIRNIPAEKLLQAQNSITQPGNTGRKLHFDLSMGPVVDGDLLPQTPSELLQNKTSDSYHFFRSLDFITGNVDTEGSIFLPLLASLAKENNFNFSNGVPLDVYCNKIGPGLLAAYFEKDVNSSQADNLLCSFYGTADKLKQAQHTLEAYGDALYYAPSVEILRDHSEGSPASSTYQYVFRRPIPDPTFTAGYPPWWQNRSAHGAELYYLFRIHDYKANRTINVPNHDDGLQTAILKYWTNFAKTGNPNSNDVPQWDTYDVISQKYSSMGTTITQDQHLYGSRVDLWLNRLTKLLDGSVSSVIFG